MKCAWCSTEFQPRESGGKEQRYCSAQCRKAVDRAGRKIVSALLAGKSPDLSGLPMASLPMPALLTEGLEAPAMNDPVQALDHAIDALRKCKTRVLAREKEGGQ